MPLFYGKVKKSRELLLFHLTLSFLFIGMASGVKLHPHFRDEEWYIIFQWGWNVPLIRVTHCKKGESHKLSNDTGKPMLVLSIKRA